MIEIFSADVDIEKIAESGQCFRMNRVDEEPHTTGAAIEYEIVARDKYLRIGQRIEQDVDRTIKHKVVLDCTKEEFDSFWSDYLDLSTDYEKIRNRVDSSDKYLTNAVALGQGIRILKQDLWEMIVTFLISQQNNIPRIKKCIDNICTRYGGRIYVDALGNNQGKEVYAFPEVETLASLPEDALMECNLGYRSKYVVRTAREIVEGKYDLDKIMNLDYEKARKTLLEMYGVGVKVADCISLFALHHVDAFPIDTHIKQVLDREYPQGFDFERYQGIAGIIQQYIFYYELHKEH